MLTAATSIPGAPGRRKMTTTTAGFARHVRTPAPGRETLHMSKHAVGNPTNWARLTAFLVVAAIPCATSIAQSTTTAATAPATAAAVAPPSVVAVATVDAYWSADQYAKTSGYLSEVKADIGDHVTKGQVLAVIDAPEVEIEVTAARATLSARQEMAKAAAAAVEQSRTALEVSKRQAIGARSEQRLAEAT